MKIGTRLLFSLYVGFVAASFVYFLYGPSGFFALGDLRTDVVQLEKNLDDLKKIHQELAVEFDTLRRSSDEVVLRARDLGYIRDHELVLELGSIWKKPMSYYAVGRIVAPHPLNRSRRPISVIAGFMAMTAAFLLAAGFNQSPNRRA